MTGVGRAGDLTVTPDPGPGADGAAGVAGAGRAAPQGGADDVRHGAPRWLPEDQGRAGSPGGGAVLRHQGLRQQAGTTQVPQLSVKTDSQLGHLGPAGELSASLRRQREVITAEG